MFLSIIASVLSCNKQDQKPDVAVNAQFTAFEFKDSVRKSLIVNADIFWYNNGVKYHVADPNVIYDNGKGPIGVVYPPIRFDTLHNAVIYDSTNLLLGTGGIGAINDNPNGNLFYIAYSPELIDTLTTFGYISSISNGFKNYKLSSIQWHGVTLKMDTSYDKNFHALIYVMP